MAKVTLFQRETEKKVKSGSLLGNSVSGVGYAVDTGEGIVRDNNYAG